MRRSSLICAGLTTALWSILTGAAFAQQPYFNDPIIDSYTSGLNLGLTSLPVPSTADYDHILMDVCVDAQDRPLPQDPLTCPNSRRNLRIGEDIPYSRIAKRISNADNITGYNVPILFGNRVRALNYRTGAALNPTGTRRFRHFGEDDSYDVYDSLNGYTFIYGTRDPDPAKKIYSYIWCGDFGSQGGGWMSYLNAHLNTPGSYGSGTFSILGGDYASCTPTDVTLTEWGFKSNRMFASGITIPVMKSVHYAGGMDQIELYYISDVLGVVRWEAWKTEQLPPSNNLCSGSGETAADYTVMVRFGRTYYRTMCVDWSFFRAHDRPLHPYDVPWRNGTEPLSHVFTTSPNLLVNGDFWKYSAEHWTAITNDEMVYGMSTDASDYGNQYMFLNKTGAVYTSSVYQTVTPKILYSHSVIQGGLLVRGPATRQVVVEVTVSWSGGSQTEKLRVRLPNTYWTPVRFNIPFNFVGKTNVTMKYKVYVKGVGLFGIDEAFLAILPEDLQQPMIEN